MKTSELSGAALDWAVAKCEGIEIVAVKGGRATFLDPTDDGARNEMHINYCTDWSQGGPIIERENMCVNRDDSSDEWEAHRSGDDFGVYWGSTPLIAAMRCYVASKLGDEIEVPEGLK